MDKLGVAEEDLSPHVIDNRSAELVRDYRQVIIKAVEEWMDRMAVSDKKNFLNRDENALETDENGIFRTKVSWPNPETGALPEAFEWLRDTPLVVLRSFNTSGRAQYFPLYPQASC